eukprot:CAMPEP_0173114186 /NCGR_PEP_ID=MMETSP1102-20130122/47442_1 /TAXON_ID=49646 /ORGANISM="Geminigera sp., Strain Caron Lab Isolate" /LENGTH=85 /DNA_ID=CAMNT_0014016357 /DNA_START=414 /DNA_END=668 /DNA_ORIENTATION=+
MLFLGDSLLEINGTTVHGKPIAEVADLLLGSAGTPVELSLLGARDPPAGPVRKVMMYRSTPVYIPRNGFSASILDTWVETQNKSA